MCGIVGYVGAKQAIPVIMEGLEHLEYRGYDSAGVACYDERHDRLFVEKEKGKLEELRKKLEKHSIKAHVGIGHTRWATHGEPSRLNAHPHVDKKGNIVLVHNGIIENYSSLKAELQAEGFEFLSQTDTEVAVHLIARYSREVNFQEALRKAIKRLTGFFAFVILDREDPEKLYVFRRSNPLVIGLGKGENFVASDVPAFLAHTKRVLYLEDDEYGVITRDRVEVYSLWTGKKVQRKPVEITWSISQAAKGGFPHFMLKEIHEQPVILQEALERVLNPHDQIKFETISRKISQRLRKVEKVFMVSCGTAYHAGICGAVMMEEYARIPCYEQVSSEFRYSDPILCDKDMVVLITQSGETADTLAALREAKSKGALTLAIVNVLGSTVAREADAVIYTHAGPEIGVASTKAYTAQLITLAFLALYLGRLKKALPYHISAAVIAAAKKLPAHCVEVLKQDKIVKACARRHRHCKNFLYLGRGYNYPTALEGALKLKEISYAHAHGYAAGEMKHGPIALIDSHQPVICLAPESRTYEKMISNIEEIRARKGIVLSIGTEGDKTLKKLSVHYFPIPKVPEILSPILTVLILQLLAYYVAAMNGRDVDKPRNLAKSVTVE
ncbi:MAG: glutamine--fructose-6-phosphate transaminase (isomerizing) [Candidatus Omnitrophota bacterium]|jgi:glucosamine--fructose-6-phosphate aminotransferase (isomerizing)